MKTIIRKSILFSLIIFIQLGLIQGQSTSRPQYDIYNTTVIYTSGGYNLTMGDFNKEIMFGEFVLGRTLNYIESQEAYREAIDDFKQNPMQNLQNISYVTQTMGQIYAIQDALQVALIRNSLVAEIYAIYRNSSESSVLYSLIKKYIHILDYDPKNKLVLTQENIDGLFSLYEFTAQVNNTQYQPSYQDIIQTKQQILEIFKNGTLDQKQYLCVTEVYNQLMRSNYENMNSHNQEQLLDQYLDQYPQTNQYNANTRDAYRMLGNLSLQNHASMMNSIEAIGGSGDYWYLK